MFIIPITFFQSINNPVIDGNLSDGSIDNVCCAISNDGLFVAVSNTGLTQVRIYGYNITTTAYIYI